jgi:hypothetical protein
MNRKGQYWLAHDYAKLNVLTGQRVNAHEISLIIRARYDAGVDWHECATALDQLHTLGFYKIVGHTRDGATIYERLALKE